ncbi:hypothetical protein Cst_c00300 [Thermoclostridium stercorarium subsp. stercorarium DSM 8532]|uniref:Uncharacterized protein n=1 Tax=Thermoclostridium stercorarium (strain ATCC 35414 / DSM 8532 / NCIMB 11754) TaxID=1121335 RepID=L7VK17_THES1|nr:hypothetical protein Cst_c00300 [Thermoclostridium stercorarium subsp. stercorarium DSM 8532]
MLFPNETFLISFYPKIFYADEKLKELPCVLMKVKSIFL